MSELRLTSSYQPDKIPAQVAFRRSSADILGYGGALAMAGGKSRTITELAFDWALDHPGIFIPIFRQLHSHITDTTRRTFFEQVLPPELRNRKDLVRIKNSGGQDFIEFLFNGSQIHFVGLDNPGRVFSAEFGGAMFDEAHEIAVEDVQLVNSRLRQRCPVCIVNPSYDEQGAPVDCDHYPAQMVFAFNPSFPGHWLHEWFIHGATRTEHGYYKPELIQRDADKSLGSVEFFVAKARDNPFVAKRYVERNLAGMSTLMRKRFLDGLWIHIAGHGFFDEEAVTALQEHVDENPPIREGELEGDYTGKDKDDPPRIVEKRLGRLHVFKPAVRWHTDKAGNEQKAHRYIIGIDTSSGAAADYSGIQVLDVDTYEQAAEWQGKTNPDTLAEIAFLLGCYYNAALLAPEITGGWGHGVVTRLQSLGAKWQGNPDVKPKLYMRPTEGRLHKMFTDKLGFDTNRITRAAMLTQLEALIREGEITVHGSRTVAELAAFAFPEANMHGEYGPPRAQPGAHDDLVIPLAIACQVATRFPRQVRRVARREEPIAFTAAGM